MHTGETISESMGLYLALKRIKVCPKYKSLHYAKYIMCTKCKAFSPKKHTEYNNLDTDWILY